MARITYFLSCLLFLTFSSLYELSGQSTSAKEVTIGFIADGNWQLLPRIQTSIQGEIRKLTRNDFDVRFPAEKSKVGNWTSRDIRNKINDLMADPSVDIVITVGSISSDVAGKLKTYKKPLISTTVLEPQLQGLPIVEGKYSGVDNFTYVVTPFSGTRDARLFHDIFPYRKLGVVIHKSLVENLKIFDEYTSIALDSIDSEFKILSYEHDQTSNFLSSLTTDSIDAILFGPVLLNGVINAEKTALIQGINELKIPSFALLGGQDVELGVMAGMASSVNVDLVGKRVGLDVFKILNGQNASKLKVTLDTPEELRFNMETIRKIDFYPSWKYLSEAVLINEEVDDGTGKLNYAEAIQEALKNNRAMMSAEQAILSADQDVRQAVANWRPQISASYSTALIDDDRAEGSFGQQTEFAGNANISISQVLFSEQISAGIDIEKQQRKIAVQARNETELDIVLQAGVAYLNLLRAKTAESVQKQNLSLTRKNLEFAESRTAIGYSRTTDVYRWENQIALAKRDLLNARASRKNAEYQLNRVLFRPVDQPVFTNETGINDPNLSTNNDVILSLIDNPKDFAVLEDFFVEYGLLTLPELSQLSTRIAIQERLIALNRRQLYLPVFAVEGSYSNRLIESGAGANAGPIEIPGIGTIGTAVDNQFWNIALTASIPIYTGNGRKATLQQSKIDLKNLNLQRQNATIQFEQLIRSNMQTVRAAFTSIGLTQEAAHAARLNYEIVKDSYSRGLVSVIQLIDAQNAAVNSDLLASNAVYEFIIELMRLERSTGNFYVTSTPAQREEVTNQLKEFISNQE